MKIILDTQVLIWWANDVSNISDRVQNIIFDVDTEVDPKLGALSILPYLPIILTYQNHSIRGSGLLDTGSSVNVLPYEMGLSLGTVLARFVMILMLISVGAIYKAAVLFGGFLPIKKPTRYAPTFFNY